MYLCLRRDEEDAGMVPAHVPGHWSHHRCWHLCHHRCAASSAPACMQESSQQTEFGKSLAGVLYTLKDTLAVSSYTCKAFPFLSLPGLGAVYVEPHAILNKGSLSADVGHSLTLHSVLSCAHPNQYIVPTSIISSWCIRNVGSAPIECCCLK